MASSCIVNLNPFSFFLNPNFSQNKSIPKLPSTVFLKPSLSAPLLSSPAPPFPGRADVRVWSGRRDGSKGKGKSKRSTVTMECTKCKKNRYITEKHSMNTPGKMELNKYCPNCRIHTSHCQIK